jgi:hypothetical protein
MVQNPKSIKALGLKPLLRRRYVAASIAMILMTVVMIAANGVQRVLGKQDILEITLRTRSWPEKS